MKETIVKINLKKVNVWEDKISKTLARLIKKKKREESDQHIRNEKWEVTIEKADMQMTIRDYYEQLYDSNGKGNGNPLHCSCLENPRDRGASLAAIYRVGHDWCDLAAAATYDNKLITWKKWTVS